MQPDTSIPRRANTLRALRPKCLRCPARGRRSPGCIRRRARGELGAARCGAHVSRPYYPLSIRMRGVWRTHRPSASEHDAIAAVESPTSSPATARTKRAACLRAGLFAHRYMSIPGSTSGRPAAIEMLATEGTTQEIARDRRSRRQPPSSELARACRFARLANP